MTDLGPNFYKRLLEVSNSVGMPPEFILNVIAVESSFDPSAGAGHSAAGLFQIMPKNLKHFGYQGTAADFRKEPPEVQGSFPIHPEQGRFQTQHRRDGYLQDTLFHRL